MMLSEPCFLITTPVYDYPGQLQAVTGTVAQHDIPVRDALIVKGKWTLASGTTAVDTLLDSHTRFSALVASNDDMAIGALKQLYARGVRVPEQISVIGFDDVPTAAYTIPALSSVKMPLDEMVQDIIQKLLSLLDGGPQSQHKAFPAQLILRDSVTTGPFYQKR